MDIHCDDGDFTCDTCLFQYNRIKLLEDHLMNSPGHTSGQVRGISAQNCNICDENFISRKDLKQALSDDSYQEGAVSYATNFSKTNVTERKELKMNVGSCMLRV